MECLIFYLNSIIFMYCLWFVFVGVIVRVACRERGLYEVGVGILVRYYFYRGLEEILYSIVLCRP